VYVFPSTKISLSSYATRRPKDLREDTSQQASNDVFCHPLRRGSCNLQTLYAQCEFPFLFGLMARVCSNEVYTTFLLFDPTAFLCFIAEVFLLHDVQFIRERFRPFGSVFDHGYSRRSPSTHLTSLRSLARSILTMVPNSLSTVFNNTL
jgi:hypothetical protein